MNTQTQVHIQKEVNCEHCYLSPIASLSFLLMLNHLKNVFDIFQMAKLLMLHLWH